MKSFDLKAALAGHPVVTRDGRPVKIAAYNHRAKKDHAVIGWIDGIIYWWDAAGKCSCDKQIDLFMHVETTYLLLHRHKGKFHILHECSTYLEADKILRTYQSKDGIDESYKIISIELH